MDLLISWVVVERIVESLAEGHLVTDALAASLTARLLPILVVGV